MLRSLVPVSITILQARPLLEEKNFPVLIDEKILESHDVQVFQLYLMVKLAEKCLNKNPTKRETMEDVCYNIPFLVSYSFFRLCN